MGNTKWVAPPSQLLTDKWPIQTNTQRPYFYCLEFHQRFLVSSLKDSHSSGMVESHGESKVIHTSALTSLIRWTLSHPCRVTAKEGKVWDIISFGVDSASGQAEGLGVRFWGEEP